MKNICTLLLLSVVIYCSSCGNGANDGVKVLPVEDSSSKGGFFHVIYTNDSFQTKDFYVNDYKKGGWAVYTLFASVVYNHTDSLYHLEMQLIDQKMTRVAVNI